MANKILIVGPSWVGDMVMAQALFKALRQRDPGCLIDVLAPAWSLPILERMPEVRKGIVMPVGHGSLNLGMRWQLAQSMRPENYQQAILLPNSLKSALLPAFAKIPQRTGWRGEMRYGLVNDIRLLDKRKYPLMVERFVALAYEAGATLPDTLPRPNLEIDSSQLSSLRERVGLAGEPFIALCPGAEFGPAKRWPEAHYASVASDFIERGWRVAIFGSEKDQAVGAAIEALLPAEQQLACFNLAGSTALADAVDLLSAAAAVVSNDSGLMHIAAALSRPLVVVYGSTSPAFTPPLSDRVSVQKIAVDCGPCFQRECPQEHLKCLQGLAPAGVIGAVDALLTEDGRALNLL